MSLEITLIYTILLVSFTLVLSVRVLDLRNSPVTKFLHPKDRKINPEMLQRAIRAHGNLIEYAPLFLILLFLCELSNLNSLYLHVAGIFFFLGRLMHGIGFGFTLHSPILRIGGMSLTFLGFLILLILASYQLVIAS
ncbi:MAG: MAPEG family protein [Gammaproteobacteria bacterium]|jgi:uncharacterized membrane protein YecN with MAPEG domain|tara:strand:+ start:1997 stop:2407 length:411 start_codon:yes stop_codon:yes gene_type:complete